MYTVKILLVLLCIALFCECAEGQSFNSGKNRKTYKGIKAQFPHHGFGFKLGDPFALTYKFYGSQKFSFALDFGRAASSLYNRYFRQKFNTYISSDTFRTSDASISYISHKVTSDLTGEVKLLYHVDAKEISPGLAFYLGGGWEWKDTNVLYTYLYSNSGSEGRPGQFKSRRLTMGPQLIVGIEYGDFKVPVSAFMELEYYKDIQVDPDWYRFEGGVGLRYIF
jgi:hypothetical protein